MAIIVKHSKVSTVPDGDDTSVVRPSDWNADHQLTGTIPVENGGTGASTLTGYVKGNGTANMTASATVPSTDITGLGTMSAQNANSVSITGGSISGTTVAGYVPTTTTITAGTGLTGGGDLSANRTLSISNTTVTAAAYGSASKTLTATVNAQGQLTALADTNIAITNTQVSGLGTASTKDAGAALGVATLDSSGKVPVSELPAAVLGALSYQGTWDASTNTPTLTSSVGTKGYYYVVSVAGSTNLNGITDWLVGDWAVYNGTAWQKVDNTDAVTSVNGFTGAVSLTTTNIAEGTNLYYTDVRARASNSAGTGISYDSATGVITNSAPDQTVSLTGGTGISTSGTYPNFTITNTSPSLGGDVVGPTGATDNAVARYDTTTGKLIQNSLVIIDDTGSVTGVNALTAQSLTVNNNATLGSSNTDSLDVRARISSDLDPETNNAKDIGSNGRNWRDAFFGRTVHTVNLELTGTTSFDGSQGTSGQVLTSAGTGNTPTWTTPTTGTVTSVTGTAPVVSSGGATPAISMAAATSSVDGYLTSTDWNTFNNKGSGTVTSVSGTGTVNGISLSGTVTSSGNLTLGGTLSNVSLSTQVTGTLPIANGGTGETTRQAAMDTLAGAVTSGQYLRGDGTDVVMSAIQAADVPTLNQNTTGSAGSVANALTAGTGLTASATFNGSAAVTFNATGTTINSQTSAYVLVAGDAGKAVSITTGGVTINNSVMSAGNIVTIYNNSGSSQTITQGSGVTLQWAGQSSSTTGNRTLGLYGMATVLFISASTAVITGVGLT
jgi:hypothetical protein